MNVLKLISDSGLHDYKVISVHIDNDTSIIDIALTDLHQKRVNILIERFTDLKISNREPWRKGTYIVSSDIRQIKDATTMIFELNSGDIIHIEFYRTRRSEKAVSPFTFGQKWFAADIG